MRLFAAIGRLIRGFFRLLHWLIYGLLRLLGSVVAWLAVVLLAIMAGNSPGGSADLFLNILLFGSITVFVCGRLANWIRPSPRQARFIPKMLRFPPASRVQPAVTRPSGSPTPAQIVRRLDKPLQALLDKSARHSDLNLWTGGMPPALRRFLAHGLLLAVFLVGCYALLQAVGLQLDLSQFRLPAWNAWGVYPERLWRFALDHKHHMMALALALIIYSQLAALLNIWLRRHP